jgi:hypothetical protein
MVLDDWQDRLKRSTLLRVSRTHLAQLRTATHTKYLYSMWQATGCKEGGMVAVVVAADPRQVAHPGALSLSCRGERVEGAPAQTVVWGPTSQPLHKGEGERGMTGGKG